MKNSPLEHRILKHLRELDQKSLLLAVSGGLDSMVLLEVLYRLKPLVNLHLVVAHVHHGSSNTFRNHAQSHVISISQSKGLPWITNSPHESCGSSEDEMRTFRYKYLESWANQKKLTLVTAHNSDDLLETQLLRLIRGVGPQGLPSMTLMDEWGKFRPLLEWTRFELEEYATKYQVSSLKDPSNENRDYLRNWLRRDWLPQLEQKSPGSLKSLARSLSCLSQNLKSPSLSHHCQLGKLNLKSLLTLTRPQKASLIAQFMKHKGIKNYQQTHIEEVLKRLQSPSCKDFHLLHHQWIISHGEISVVKRQGSPHFNSNSRPK